ncbi:dephospho-CoA kinase [Candidatus Palauibacter sp.]|uniref:dephospho-CoA kinase n=1 Tax=Candidatus Palauibacter sp. TaxID=3101350 RepID=UPI003AF29409
MKPGPPYRVGLTGTVAAGKSAVARRLAEWGATVIDSDELARELVQPGFPAFAGIRDAFGEDVIGSDGTIDREVLGRLVFEDDAARATLERISHSGIRELRARLIAEATAAGARVIVEEVPLLFEVGLEADYDVIVVVDAPQPLRQARARTSRGWSAERFAAIDAAQLPGTEKRRRAHRVLDNAGKPEELDAAVRELWKAVLSAAAEGREDLE